MFENIILRNYKSRIGRLNNTHPDLADLTNQTFPIFGKNSMPLDAVFPPFLKRVLFIPRTLTTVTTERGWCMFGHYTSGNASATSEPLKRASNSCTMQTTIPQILFWPSLVSVLSTAFLVCETTAV